MRSTPALFRPSRLVRALVTLSACAGALFTGMPAQAAWNADTGVVLVGKVVTLNDVGDVLPHARVWLAGGSIKAIVREGEALPDEARGAPVVDSKGVIYPGIIDLHNHPEYAIYPLLPIQRKYRDRYEWRWYDDVYNKRITFPQEVLTRPYYLDLGLEIGRYGEYKALAGGTTSLQGGRTNLAYSKEECLVRNIENSHVESRVAASRVDIGRSSKEWAAMQDERAKGPLVVHLAEGPSPRMATEFFAIKDSNLLGPELIAIHGVGLTQPQLLEMAAVGAKLVWSPLSNFMLYGQTANVAAAKRAGLSISLAPDWAPSGSKSSLGELKVADLVNKHALKNLFSDRELVDMVTRKPAEAMGWGQRLGRIEAGYLADVLVVDERDADPYRNLILATEDNIQLVAVRGEPLYGDRALLTQARGGDDGVETTWTLRKGHRAKAMTPNCPGTSLPTMSVAETQARIQQGLKFDAAQLAAKLTPEQVAKDFGQCGITESVDATQVSVKDTKRLLACRFGLPFERTRLSPLTTNADPDFMAPLMKNPNLPRYLRQLPAYYR
ncbi:MAG: amidohydrolase family protein [Burkholderiales bacterium]|nr:amidohydrolase family protein [Burkholderiales bacterium]